ncbi:MAG: hypothetical protein CVV27_03010 [Candidatus Melainabacteria bacterium HGW-Melainabacteria-1]|nr:MAG: hypothetical protein CVV27_03010 [Candidatus Melainabacteria bacterium HGW-Melainabacteria-1]
MSVVYLTRADLIGINQRLCQHTRQPFGLCDAAALDQAVQRPGLWLDGYEPFPEIWEKAAVLLDSLAKGSAFLRANRLTGFLAADQMLRQNGYRLQSQAEDAELITSVSLQQVTVLQIAEWLRGRAQEQTEGANG